jgi:hypothetical protein
MNFLPRGWQPRLLKSISGSIDRHYECLRTTAFQETVDHPPAYSRFEKIIVNQLLPARGLIPVALLLKMLIKRLHKVVNPIPRAVFDQGLTFTPNIRIFAPVVTVRELA